jgi:outer membrane protein insertion porin family
MFLHLRLPGKFWLVKAIFSAILVEILTDSQVAAQVKPSFAPQQPTVVTPENFPKQPRRRSKTPVFSGQKVRNRAVVPPGNQEIITEILVRFVDEAGNLVPGKTKPRIITQEFALQPGDIYRADLAQKGLQGVLDLVIVERASLRLEKSPQAANKVDNRVIMAIAVQENSNLSIGFDLTLPAPTALQGSVRPTTVQALSDSSNGFSTGVQVSLLNLGGSNQGVSLGVEGGTEAFGFNLGYRKFLQHDRGFGINVFNRRGIEAEYDRTIQAPEFIRGTRSYEENLDINLDNASDPVVHRFGGGVEYFRPLAEDWQSALGVSYQRVSVRDRAFSSNIESRDALGNSLTVSEGGQDDLLTLNFATVLEREDNPRNPTRGYKFQFGSDQYLPIGDAQILANRLAVNYTHYSPLPLFGFTEGAKTLVFNLQGGTILGDAVPYEAFILGGSSLVRGYGASEISTARSFVQGTLEYRYPILTVKVWKNQIDLGGTFFLDYSSDLGSADAVIGQPGIVRDRPSAGLGYGLGLRALTPIGIVRTEFALSDKGETKFIFDIGDRF